jgi:hypothetical protein
MRTDQYAILLQSRQVSPHRGGGNPQSSAEVGSGNGALTGKDLSNAKSALFCEHNVWLSWLPNLARIGGSAAPIVFGMWTICTAKSVPPGVTIDQKQTI